MDGNGRCHRSDRRLDMIFEQLVPAPAGRFTGVERPYSPADVARLRGSLRISYTLAQSGANRLWELLHTEPYLPCLGAMTGNQAMQMVRAGLKAIYLSGWQVAADANTAGTTYPDQSLYPCDSGPDLCRRINRALARADQIEHAEGGAQRNWFAPIVADAEAGFGGPLNVFEIMKAYIEAGAAGVHFEDQLASEKKCGHLGGKVLIPTMAHERNLIAARLAADVCGEQTPEGFYRLKPGTGLDHCIKRGLAFARYADLLWWETSRPDLAEARRFARAIHREFPGKLLAYNCSPSFNWRANLEEADIARFQTELGAMGYKFQFVTLAGFHSLNHGMFELARGYRERGMTAYSELQRAEFASEAHGYSATRHQREVGTGYFDLLNVAVSGAGAPTAAMAGSTEALQFQ